MKRKPWIGDTVRHWFAGTGVVRRIIGHICYVEWETRGSGWSYMHDCKVIQ